MAKPTNTTLQHVIRTSNNVHGKPGKPPRSVKGRVLKANNMGPWDMLKAMRRLQLGEPILHIAASYDISPNTLQRWQARWGGDVAHVRWHLDAKHVEQIEICYMRLERRLKRELSNLLRIRQADAAIELVQKLYRQVSEDLDAAEMHMVNITGEGERYFRKKRLAAEQLRPSKSRFRVVQPDKPSP